MSCNRLRHRECKNNKHAHAHLQSENDGYGLLTFHWLKHSFVDLMRPNGLGENKKKIKTQSPLKTVELVCLFVCLFA